MKSRHFRSIALTIISVGIIAAFVYYLYLNADQYQRLLNISVPGAIALFALTLAFPVLNGLQNILLYRSLGIPISYWDGYLITAASTLANQLPISGGVVSKGFYLKQRYNLSYTTFISSTVALFVCFIAANALVGLGILLYWIFFDKMVVNPVLLLTYIGMAAFILIFWFPLDRIKVPGKIQNWSAQAIEGWVLISKNPVLLFRLIGLQFLLMLLLAARYWLAFHMLSQNVTMTQTLLFASASILTQLVSIAPGGLGVREALVGTVAATLGFDPAVSAVAVGLDRLASTLMVLMTGWFSTVVIGKQMSEARTKPDEQNKLSDESGKAMGRQSP